MINIIIDNIGTIVVSALISAAVILASMKLYKDKRVGKSSCGGGCGSCPYSADCGGNRDKKQHKTLE